MNNEKAYSSRDRVNDNKRGQIGYHNRSPKAYDGYRLVLNLFMYFDLGIFY